MAPDTDIAVLESGIISSHAALLARGEDLDDVRHVERGIRIQGDDSSLWNSFTQFEASVSLIDFCQRSVLERSVYFRLLEVQRVLFAKVGLFSTSNLMVANLRSHSVRNVFVTVAGADYLVKKRTTVAQFIGCTMMQQRHDKPTNATFHPAIYYA